MGETEKYNTYKSLSSFASVVKGKREVWRELFKNPDFGKYFIIENRGVKKGIRISTSLTEIEIKKLFLNYKKVVSKRRFLKEDQKA